MHPSDNHIDTNIVRRSSSRRRVPSTLLAIGCPSIAAPFTSGNNRVAPDRLFRLLDQLASRVSEAGCEQILESISDSELEVQLAGMASTSNGTEDSHHSLLEPLPSMAELSRREIEAEAGRQREIARQLVVAEEKRREAAEWRLAEAADESSLMGLSARLRRRMQTGKETWQSDIFDGADPGSEPSDLGEPSEEAEGITDDAADCLKPDGIALTSFSLAAEAEAEDQMRSAQSLLFKLTTTSLPPALRRCLGELTGTSTFDISRGSMVHSLTTPWQELVASVSTTTSAMIRELKSDFSSFPIVNSESGLIRTPNDSMIAAGLVSDFY
ncbi:unnamed protein product [Protopolystoma xenopodis]|uniref:Uncharacterized protein n=1 Tax=Protopolystoma xenopodis TaxID=117903 RepID=A0A448XSD9_9PLAT|nr:unnamed protein product [Protopolystoma xenopodis]